ncbi:MAG: hypothetical protein WBQ68_02345 [Terriglobales bacterium]
MKEVVTFVNRGALAERDDSVELGNPGAGRFRVCDLVIESNVHLPELKESGKDQDRGPQEDRFDCRFQVLEPGEGFEGEVNWFRRWSTQDSGVWLDFGMRGEDYLLRFPGHGDFLISRDGSEVQCCPLPRTPASTIRHLFLDQVIPLILSRREPLVLHASAVLTPQGAIAFVGKSGQGKSTVAASFGQIGCPLISDDYLVLRETALRKTALRKTAQRNPTLRKAGANWIAIPSYPGVRLWPRSSDGIFSALPETMEIAHYTEKRRVSDLNLLPFAEVPSSLRGVYFLADSGEESVPSGPTIVLSNPREAFMKLVACTFSLDVRDRVLLRKQFDAIAQLRSSLPCFRLEYAREFSALPALRQLILDHQTRNESWM